VREGLLAHRSRPAVCQMKHQNLLYLLAIGAGVGVALLVLTVIPGNHNSLDAKLALVLGATAGYLIAYLTIR